MTTRRWLAAVVIAALLSWLAILCRPLFQHSTPDPFDATEMIGPDSPEPK